MQLPAAFPSHPTHPKFQDLTGQRFGSLVVVGYAHARAGNSYWWCRCDCGEIRTPAAIKLRRGSIKSCGCQKVRIGIESTTHGHTKGRRHTPEYESWCSMRQRVLNPATKNFDNYGGRGIEICERWLLGEDGKSGFECFFGDMGTRPSPDHSLDRFPNNNGNYEPGNCRWANSLQQSRNRRSVRVEVLFFDLATRSGWACGGKSGLWEFGTFDCPRTHDDIGRFLNVAHGKVHDLVARLRPHKIAFESPFLNRHVDTIIKIRKLSGLANVVEQVADRHGIACQEAIISDICRHFLGPDYPRRSQEKKAATKVKCRDLGIAVDDDNAADAIAGLSYMLAIAHPKTMANIMPLFGERLGDGK